jgi:serine-type D-Ala-D-Ala carboxypeptidase/endopeptidase (penicillin-binding protein 4)
MNLHFPPGHYEPDTLMKNSHHLRSAITLFSIVISGCATSGRMVQDHVAPSAALLSRSPYPSLKKQIDAFLPDTLFPPASAGIRIVSLPQGETLYELNPDLLFNPASNEKLFTTSTALNILGEQFRFITPVSFDTTGGVPRIYVKGSGDPLMATSDLDSIASTLATVLPSGLTWSIVGDKSFFDDQYFGAGWMWDDEPSSDGMCLSPLSVNANCVNVIVRPGTAAGDTATVTVDPPTQYVSAVPSAVTVTDTVMEPLQITRAWRERLNAITVEGQILSTDTLEQEKLSVWQPERYFLTLLAECLERRGIPVGSIGFDTVSATAQPVLMYSHGLDSAVTFLNKVSDNMSAENVLKTIGAVVHNVPGSADAGIAVVRGFLGRAGIDTSKIVIADGSGLSRYDLTSATTITALLTTMYRSTDHFPTFYNSLPSAGIDGTLSGRMRGTAAQGNLHAKTGTLSGVTALSGYVRTAAGELLAFSILMQSYPEGAGRYRRAQDNIGVFLSNLRRSDL